MILFFFYRKLGPRVFGNMSGTLQFANSGKYLDVESKILLSFSDVRSILLKKYRQNNSEHLHIIF